MLNFIRTQVCAAAFGASLLALGANAATAQEVRIGAMREGSSWYVFAATLEQIVEPIIGANSMEVIARGGGVATRTLSMMMPFSCG